MASQLLCLIAAMVLCSAQVSASSDGSCPAKLAGKSQYTPASSCSALPADSTSGHYWIRPVTGQPAVRLYCDFDGACGCDGASSTWTRVAFLDMSNPNHRCPDGWKRASPRSVRACTGKGLLRHAICNSAFFSTHQLSYSRVCGRVIAYQHGIPDAFNELVFHGVASFINSTYVDGVSITHGSVGSREHIWTFAAARGDVDTDVGDNGLCDCSNSNPWPYLNDLGFVGNDYFCDTASHETTVNVTSTDFYPDDPLWDGAGCSGTSTCCEFNNPPWFCQTLPQPTTDDLEVRICHIRGPEDTPIEVVELYVQ